MEDPFHYDPSAYHEQVAHIAQHVVSNDDAIATFSPPIDVELNSYHGTAIKDAEQERLRRLYPRLYL